MGKAKYRGAATDNLVDIRSLCKFSADFPQNRKHDHQLRMVEGVKNWNVQ